MGIPALAGAGMIARMALFTALAAAFTTSSVDAQTHALIVAGVGGEPQYSRQFVQWATTMSDALVKRGVPAANVTVLAETAAPPRIGRSSRDEITKAMGQIAQRSRPGEQVLIMLIGHGSAEGDAKFSIPGPDLTALEFVKLLDDLNGRKVAVVNAASASGAFIEPLAAKGRTIITATRSGMERNETTFAQHFVDAFAKDVADTDKDNRTTMLEAFTYAKRETARFYEQQNRLLTEHAVLEDNGDGKPSSDPDGKAEGAVARLFAVGGASAGAPANANAEVRALYDQRAAIQRRLDALRAAKDDMKAEDYEKQLETLLVELAQKNQEIRRKEGGA